LANQRRTGAGLCHGRLSWAGVLMYKVSFYTHRVAVLIAELMTLMLSLDVLSLSSIGICHVGSTGLERR
jgi:hypothetical protein